METIEINDEEYHNPMPAQAYLTDQQIADILTYVRNSFGNKASAVTAGEVKAVRGGAKVGVKGVKGVKGVIRIL